MAKTNPASALLRAVGTASETVTRRGDAAVAAPVAEAPPPEAPPTPRPAPARAASWRYRPEGGRDLRFDFLRGFAVFAMVADHLAGPSWLHTLTGGNRFFVSAAEGFVFISGVVVGIVYGGRVRAGGLRAAAPKLLGRAWLLYVLAVWLAIATAFLAALFNLPIGAAFLDAPARFIVEVLTLRRTFYLVDVLLLYLFLMLLAPPALALLRAGHWRALALASWGLWAAYQFFPRALQLPWPIASNPAFNFAPWQILFFTGLLLGYHRRQLAERAAIRWPNPWLRALAPAGAALALGALVALLAWLSATNAAAFDRLAPDGDAAAVLDAWFDKSALPPARLAACAVLFAFCWALTTAFWRPLRAAAGPVLLVFGQGALYAYAAHLFLVVASTAAIEQVAGTGPGGGFPPLHPGVNAAIQIAGLALLWAMTRARFLQSLVAPLGAPPFSRLRLPAAARPRPFWRPNDSLVALALVGAIAFSFVLTPGAARPVADGGPAVRPTTTAIAPRRIGGAARGSSAPRATPTVTKPRSVGGPAQGSSGVPTATAGLPAGVADPAAAAGGELRDGEFYSAALDRVMPYGIYLPPGYEGGTARYPVLYMLHGAGGHYSEWVDYGLAETADELIREGKIPPLIIVLPQGDGSYWTNHAGENTERWGDYVLADVVDHTDTAYRTRPGPDSRAIGGLSMGGFAALHLAFNHPDVFGTAGAHSPSLRIFEESADFTTDEEQFARNDPARLAESLDPARAPRLWLDVGREDEWAARVIALHELLASRGIPHRYSITPGDHDGSYWSAHVAEYLRFYAAALAAP